MTSADPTSPITRSATTANEREYLSLLLRVLDEGRPRTDRTGVGTRSLFGAQMRFDLRAGFPAVTTKRLAFRTMAHELLWFLSGNTNIAYLREHNVKIWNAWADTDGNLGPVYGAQWRSWAGPDGRTTDQIAAIIDQIRTNPDSRRLVVNAWNVGDLHRMALPPCHAMFQFYVDNGRLSCQLYQRSADMFLGCPFNIASYALLTHMIAQVCGLGVSDFVHTIGDAHIYENHIEQVEEQLLRKPRPAPTLWLDPSVRAIDDFTIDHIRLDDYYHHPAIAAPLAV